MIVTDYADKGNLRENLTKVIENNWNKRLFMLYKIISGLNQIHSQNLVHCDFHDGNILNHKNKYERYTDEIYISDLGLCQPVKFSKEYDIYGVIPFMAPEVLRGKPYTPANLMKKCWDEDPLKRPSAEEIENIIKNWIRRPYGNKIKSESLDPTIVDNIMSFGKILNNQSIDIVKYESGKYYQNGLEIENDIVFELYNKAAENGDSFAQYNLGLYYQEIEKDNTKAFELFEKSAKKEQGDAQNYLGYFYENGIKVQKDLEKAFYLYQKSAENGNKFAQYNLISYYLNGWKVDEKSIEQEDDKMQYKLGYFYEIQKNLEKSFYWYQKSATNENKFAQYNLGLYYQNGLGTEKNEIEAFKWFEKSAKQDNSDAQNYLGFLYKNGSEKIQKDLKESFNWYQKSAKNGNKIAQYNLGNFYRFGWGIEKNEIEARNWYNELAGQHNKFFVENEKFLENITNENPFSHIQFNEPIFDTNDSEFVTVKTTIFPGISETSYIEVKKLQKLLISRKDDIDHVLELQPVYTIGIDFQKNSTRPCIACWVTKSLDITVTECLKTIFEDQFEVIYKIVTPLNENNTQGFDNNNLTDYYNLEEENSNNSNHDNNSGSNGSSSNNGHNGNNNNNSNDKNGSNSINSNGDNNDLISTNNNSGNNNDGDDGDGDGDGGNSDDGNDNDSDKHICISSKTNIIVDSKFSQDFKINAKLWAKTIPFKDTALKYEIDVYACGIGELLNNKCSSLNKLGFGYLLQSIKVRVSPLPDNGSDLFDLNEASLPKQLNQKVDSSVGNEMSFNPKFGSSGVDISPGYKKTKNTSYSSQKWKLTYKGPNDDGECWLYERNRDLEINDETFTPGKHSGDWMVNEGMHGFYITITQVLRYEITSWWHKIPLNKKILLQRLPIIAHNLKVTFNDLSDFNGKFKELKPRYKTIGGVINTIGNNEIENNNFNTQALILTNEEFGAINRSLDSVKTVN
ncbi:kinase-like domain-containing protein [Rhizophagus clarus]|uniref:Kinase-like domain-containing protein n=1 Tax=Rhizophagus clarus TaxID=94130 RepID=A0A8H3QVA0_9GLOM|nr:kinase-like domain-containing protein [Rhizophagus clarus]